MRSCEFTDCWNIIHNQVTKLQNIRYLSLRVKYYGGIKVVVLRIRFVLTGLVALLLMINTRPIGAIGSKTRVIATASGYDQCFLKIAPDGVNLGFEYIKNGKQYIQINRKVYGGFEVGPNTKPLLQFSPDGKYFYFIYQKENESFLRINDETHGGYTLVKSPVFSASGKSYGFKYLKDGYWYCRIDGKEYGGYKEIGPLIFGPGNAGFGFAYRTHKYWYIRINKDKFGPYKQYWGPFFSLDGKKFGFAYQKIFSAKFRYNINGDTFGPYERVEAFSHSLDGKTFDVPYQNEGLTYLRTGLKEYGPFSGASAPPVAGGDIEMTLGVKYEKAGQCYYQVGDYTFGGYTEISPVPPSPAGKLWGFAYRKDNRNYIQIQTKSYGPYESVTGPYFSANDKLSVFAYRQKGKMYVQANFRIYPEPNAKTLELIQVACNNDAGVIGYIYKKGTRDYVRINNSIYGGRGSIYPDSLVISNNGKCFGYRYKYYGKEYIQINDKVYQCGNYYSSDFVITPGNKGVFAYAEGGRIIVQVFDY
jgi:hypothetical protein